MIRIYLESYRILDVKVTLDILEAQPPFLSYNYYTKNHTLMEENLEISRKYNGEIKFTDNRTIQKRQPFF